MSSIKIFAPAKVNLVLRVLGRRPNGYHELFMVMEKLSFGDDLILEEAASGIELTQEGDADSGMTSERNLAFRAAAAFKEATGERRGVKIHLKKRIPLAAGLGGGSSDAAAVLRGLNELWQKGFSPEELGGMGAKLGGDVPFFCHEGPAVAEGIGDIITAIPRLPNLFILLINPGFAVPTPWVYQEFDRIAEGVPLLCKEGKGEVDHNLPHPTSPYKGEGADLKLTVCNKGVSNGRLFETFCGVTSNLENDLERVTIAEYPEIGEIKSFLVSHGASGSLMSGSGPTVFGIFEDEKTRDDALVKIPKKNWKAFPAQNFSCL